MATKYVSTLTGAQMDQAMKDMNNHVSEAWATGTRGGTAVVSGDETYHNNAKYYSQNSATSASNASSSASSASSSATSASNSASSASTSATNASNSANSARTYANNASASADRAEAIVGGQFISYGTNQVEGLTEAQHKTATYNVFGKPSTSTLDFLTRVSNNNYLAKIKKLEGKSVGVNQLVTEKTLSYTEKGITFDYSGASIRIHGTATGTASHWGYSSYATDTTHKYYINAISGGSSTTYQFRYNSVGYNEPFIANGAVASSGYIVYSGTIDKTFKPIILDLTLIFGSGNEPSTVDNLKSAWLTKFGYPLPTYIPYNSGSIVDCDIKGIGATGKNIWDEEWEVGSINNSTGADYSSTTEIRAKNYCRVVPNTTLNVRIGASKTLWVMFYDMNKTFISCSGATNANTVTVPTNAYYMRVRTGGTYGATYNNDIAIGIGLTSYVSANPYYRSFPIILRSAGNVKDTVEDCGSGYKVTRRVGTVDLGSLTWTYTGGRFDSGYNIPNGKAYSSTVQPNMMCAKYIAVTGSYFDNNTTISGIFRSNDSGNGRIFIRDTNYTDASTFKTAMNGVMLNYELATPVTEYHSYNLTYPVTLNGTEYFDSPISVPCEIEYGVDALTDIASGVVNSPTDLDRASVYASNPNLLDNGWFTVNQRNFTSVTSTEANVYVADRWFTHTRGSYSRGDNGITITADSSYSVFIRQKLEKFDAGKYTLSMMFGDGTIHSVCVDLSPNTYHYAYFDGLNVYWELDTRSGKSVSIAIPKNASSITIKAVKLELGSVSTLANDNAPNYGEELAKCQRYYIRYSGNGAYVGSGIAQSATVARILTPTPIMSKSTTDIKLYGTLYIGSANGWGSNGKTATVISAQAKFPNAPFAFYTATVASGLTAGDSLEAQFRDTTSYLEISADL